MHQGDWVSGRCATKADEYLPLVFYCERGIQFFHLASGTISKSVLVFYKTKMFHKTIRHQKRVVRRFEILRTVLLKLLHPEIYERTNERKNEEHTTKCCWHEISSVIQFQFFYFIVPTSNVQSVRLQTRSGVLCIFAVVRN